MNTLSWFLYFADILPTFAIILASLSSVGFIGWFVVCLAASLDDDHRLWKYLAWFVIPITISSMIPSKNTLYAIAASEFGETLIKSETAGKVHQALDAWLDSQIKELKK